MASINKKELLVALFKGLFGPKWAHFGEYIDETTMSSFFL